MDISPEVEEIIDIFNLCSTDISNIHQNLHGSVKEDVEKPEFFKEIIKSKEEFKCENMPFMPVPSELEIKLNRSNHNIGIVEKQKDELEKLKVLEQIEYNKLQKLLNDKANNIERLELIKQQFRELGKLEVQLETFKLLTNIHFVSQLSNESVTGFSKISNQEKVKTFNLNTNLLSEDEVMQYLWKLFIKNY